ncbi:MAG: hypothetical protein AAF456_11920 [Planctomycetota bacterium]
MRMFLKSFLALFCVVGMTYSVCHAQEDAADSQVVEEIVGHWRPDVEKTKELLGDEVTEAMLDEISEISIHFNDDGTMSIAPPVGPAMEASWSAVQREDEENVYDIELTPDGVPSPLEGVITIVDRNTVHLKPGNEPPAVLVRVMSVSDLMVGEWGGDTNATIEAMQEGDAEVDEATTAMMGQHVSGMAVNMTDDGNYVLRVEGQPDVNGKWSVEQNDEGQNVLKAEPESGEELNFIVEFHDEENSLISMDLGNGDPVVYFRRK